MKRLLPLVLLAIAIPASAQTRTCTRTAIGRWSCVLLPDTVRRIDTVRISTTIHDTIHDTIFVTTLPVPLPPTPPPVVSDTLFSDGFEGAALAWDDNVLPATKVLSPAAARTGAQGLRITYQPGGAGGLSKFITRSDRVYIRAAVRFPTTWTGDTKVLLIRGATAAAPWASFGIAGKCATGADWMVTNAVTASTMLDLRFYTYFVGMRKESDGVTCWGRYGEPGDGGTASYVAPLTITKGVWHVIELEVQANTSGQTNGWQRLYLDGTLRGDWQGLIFRTTSDLQWNAVTLEFSSSTITQSQTLDVDDVLILRQRPSSITPPPSSPTPPPAPAPPPGVPVPTTICFQDDFQVFSSSADLTTSQSHYPGRWIYENGGPHALLGIEGGNKFMRAPYTPAVSHILIEAGGFDYTGCTAGGRMLVQFKMRIPVGYPWAMPGGANKIFLFFDNRLDLIFGDEPQVPSLGGTYAQPGRMHFTTNTMGNNWQQNMGYQVTPVTIADGQWHQITWGITPGAGNGRLELWVDATKVMEFFGDDSVRPEFGKVNVPTGGISSFHFPANRNFAVSSGTWPLDFDDVIIGR